MASIFTFIPVTPRATPNAVLDYVTALTGGPVSGLVQTNAGYYTAPAGAQFVEVLTPDAYLFPIRNDHTPETFAGIVRLKVLALDGDLRIGVYSYLSKNVHIRIDY